MAQTLPPAPSPDSLPELRPRDIFELGRDARIWRIYFRGGDRPAAWDGFRFFGPLRRGRFDHHLPPSREQSRGILYGAPATAELMHAALTCLAEAFQEDRTIDPSRRQPWLVAFAVGRPVLLLEVASGWTTRARGNQAICSGDWERAREWSRAIYAGYSDIEGILYPSSTFGPGRAVALFERAADAVPLRPVFHRPLNDPGLRQLLQGAALELGYELLS